MRKKFFLLFTIGILFFSIRTVNALNNDIIYDISKFSISSDNKMTLEGWSMVDHADNYGNKNLETYIIAYTGKWNDIGDSHAMSMCKSSSDTCMKYKTIAPELNSSGKNRNAINLFVSRCIGNDACGKAERHRERLFNGEERFLSTNCTGARDGYGNSHCLYYNVGFSITIDLASVYKQFAESRTIKFRILSRVRPSSGGWITRSTGLGIHENACNGNIKSACNVNGNNKYTLESDINVELTEEGETVTRTYKTLKFGGISDKIEFTAKSGTAKRNSNLTNNVDYFKTYSNFTIDKNKLKSGKSTSTVAFQKYGQTLNTLVYAVKGKHSGGQVIPGNSSTYYLPVSWGRISGSLTLINDYDEETDSDPEPTCVCVGSACDTNPESATYSCAPRPTPEPATCSGAIPEVEECRDGAFSANCNQTLDPITYYYKISRDDMVAAIENSQKVIDLKAAGGSGFYLARGASKGGVRSYVVNVVDANGNIVYKGDGTPKTRTQDYYIPVKFYANIGYWQNGSMNIVQSGTAGNKFSNGQSVVSGHFFNFSLNYNVSAGWNYLTYNDTTSVYNWYKPKAKLYVGYNDKNGVRQYAAITVFFDLNTSDAFYNKVSNINSTGEYVVNYGSSLYQKVVDNSDPLGNMLEGARNLGLNVNFPDSNKVNATSEEGVISDDVGAFTCTTSDTNVNPVSSTCNYVIPQAYADPKTGYIYYPKNNVSNEYKQMSNIGSLYYVPLGLKTGDKFEFSIMSQNLSLISYFDFVYSPVCYVTAENQISKMRYRPIDPENPFPDSRKIPSNWQEYRSVDENFARLKEPYMDTKISYRTDDLNRHSSLLKGFDSTYKGYDNRKDLNIDNSGTSYVVRSGGLFNIIRGNHCKLMEFSPDCDKAQGS